MKEQIDSLAAALLEERDMLNAALGAMHRTHMRLLDVLAKIEEPSTKDFNANMERWMFENIGVLADSLTKVDEFNSHIESIADERFEYHIVNVEVDISASLRT